MTGKEEPILELENLFLSSPERTFLSDVSLRVFAGEFLGILGRSGSGKSTLLRCILDLPLPSSWRKKGKILLFGKEKKELPPKWIQPVFQDPILGFNPTWTIERSLSEPLRLFGEMEYYENLLQKWLPVLGLSGKDRRGKPGDFSGGELQRFALLRALLCRPKLLLMDEATSALDPILSLQILEELKKRQSEEGFTVLWVTHHRRLAQKFCSRILEMETLDRKIS